MYALTIRRVGYSVCTRMCVRACVAFFFPFFSPPFRRGLKSYSSESFHKYSTWLCKFAQPASTFVNLCNVCTARVGCEILYIIQRMRVFDEFESNFFSVKNNAAFHGAPIVDIENDQSRPVVFFETSRDSLNS